MRDREFKTLARMLSESVISAAGMLFGLVMSYVLLGILTRTLSVEDFGVYGVLVSMLEMTIVVVLCGLPQAIDRYTALYNARSEPGKVRSLVVGSLVVMVALGGVGYAAVALAAMPIARAFLGGPDRAAALILFSVSFPAALLLRVALAVFVGFKQVRFFVLVDRVLIPSLKMLLGIAALAMGYGLLGWLGAYSAAMIVGLAATFGLLRVRMWPYLRVSARRPIPIREILDFAWPLMLVNATAFIAKDVPVLWLGRTGDIASAGFLRLYLQIAGLFLLVLSALSRIHLPVITELLSQKKGEEARRTHRRISKWGFVVGIYGAGAFLVLGSEFIAILFTPAYAASFGALLILCLGALTRLSCGPCHAVLRAMGATRMNLLSALVGAVALGVTGAFAIPRLGTLGASLAIALSWMTQDAVAAWQAFRRGGFSPIGSTHGRVVVLGVGMSGLFLALRDFARLDGEIWMALLGVGFTILFWSGALLWGVVDRVDRELVMSLLRRRPPSPDAT